MRQIVMFVQSRDLWDIGLCTGSNHTVIKGNDLIVHNQRGAINKTSISHYNIDMVFFLNCLRSFF